ncbi:MAG: DUF6714 family protein [Chloroflexota bacterium]
MDVDEKYRKKLARQVELAFDKSQYPGDDKIVAHPNTSISSHLPALLAGKHWKELTLEVIIQENLSLPLLTSEGFRFYLPAFLRAALLFPDQVDILPSNIFSSLTPPDEEEIQMRDFLNRVNEFTQEQIEAIKSFVKMYVAIESSYPDARRDKAISFWEQKG